MREEIRACVLVLWPVNVSTNIPIFPRESLENGTRILVEEFREADLGVCTGVVKKDARGKRCEGG